MVLATRPGPRSKRSSLRSGENLATDEDWETADWGETAKEAKAKGVPDVDNEVQGFLMDFYGKTGTKEVKDYRVVIQTYKRVTYRGQSCR
ncbi:hypothetical protein GGS26DRAFT_587533 [Hypomontagnella submonticulosa]|nr:hypothetical protein GGS26DRAFT_587533 [Hypomontagnella submonticulosa]